MTAAETYHLSLLKKIADPLAIRFLCPVYLVGSFIDKGLDAMDIDIIMVMSDERQVRLFRSKEWNERRYRFYKKQKLYFEECLHDMDIDFKVQNETEFKAHAGMKVKLDGWVCGV